MDEHSEPVSRRDRPAKPPLSRRSIVDAASGLIRERGVDAVALRHVAHTVQTGPASLYAYFANRDVLLEHVLDAAYGEVVLVDAGAIGWRPALAATIDNTIDVLASYPGLGQVALGSIPTLPGALRLAEHELLLMEQGGIEEPRAALAIDVIAQFAAATAVERTVRQGRVRSEDDRVEARAVYENADTNLYPRVTRAAAALTGPDDKCRRAFAIDIILTGIIRTELRP